MYLLGPLIIDQLFLRSINTLGFYKIICHGSQKIPRKEKMLKENNFFEFD